MTILELCNQMVLAHTKKKELFMQIERVHSVKRMVVLLQRRARQKVLITRNHIVAVSATESA